jgi:hypothetical protein
MNAKTSGMRVKTAHTAVNMSLNCRSKTAAEMRRNTGRKHHADEQLRSW